MSRERPMTVAASRRTFLVASLSAGVAAFGTPGSIRVGCQANAWPLKEGDFDQLLEVVRKMQEDFSKLAAGVVQLGGSYIVMSGRGLAGDGRFPSDALHAKAAQLEALAKTCKQQGIELAYHNHTAEFANHNAEIEGLANSTSAELVHFLIDAGHGYQGGGDPAAFLLRHSGRIVGCHIKTFRNKTVQVPLGQGDFGFEALAAAIRQTGWSGWLIDEEGGSRAGGNAAAVGPDRQYIRRVFGA